MFERLIRYAAAASAERRDMLTLQDVTLCLCWAGQPAAPEANPETRARILDQVAAWQHRPGPPNPETLGRRHQNLLRRALDRLEAGPDASIPRDMADWLLCLDQHAGQAPAMHERVLELLAPHRDRLRDAVESLPEDPVCRYLRGNAAYASAADFRAAAPEKLEEFAGVALHGHGPTLRFQTHLRILDDLPDECTAIVEDHDCDIQGYLLGRLLVRGGCDAGENVAGTVIARTGDIRCRIIVDTARAVAKGGSVHCRHARGPRAVYAARTIRATGSLRRGCYIARVVQAAEEIRGGRVEVSASAEAPYFRPDGDTRLDLVLRLELSCEDYGEVLSGPRRKMLAEAYRRRARAQALAQQHEAACHEVEAHAQSALMYLLGGGIEQRRLAEFLRLERRRDTLERLMRSLRQSLEDGLERLVRAGQGAPLPEEEIGGAVLLPPEGDAESDPDLAREAALVRALDAKLRGRANDRSACWRMLEEARAKLEKVQEQHRSLQAQLVQREEQILAVVAKLNPRTSGAPPQKLQILRHLVEHARSQPGAIVSPDRLRQPIVARAFKGIERWSKRAQEYGEDAAAARQDFDEIVRALKDEHEIHLEAGATPRRPARALGRFAPGVRVFQHLFDEDAGAHLAKALRTFDREDEAPRVITRAGAEMLLAPDGPPSGQDPDQEL